MRSDNVHLAIAGGGLLTGFFFVNAKFSKAFVSSLVGCVSHCIFHRLEAQLRCLT
jgi:hypothetical protein